MIEFSLTIYVAVKQKTGNVTQSKTRRCLRKCISPPSEVI